MKNIDLFIKYKQLSTQIKSISQKRNTIVNRHFPELLLPPVQESEDVEKRIQEIVAREIVHASVFLASSLGFTKSNWNKTIEKTLVELGLGEKLRCPSYRNMQRFEKLKHLIFKYLEKRK